MVNREMLGRIDDMDVTRPRMRVVGGSDFEKQRGEQEPRLQTITWLQLMRVRAVCEVAADENVACFDDPAPAYAMALGRVLGLDRESLETAFLATLLRDIGKLRVSRRVLFALRPMTERQRAFVRMHAEYSGQICESLELRARVAAAVRAHHERWDGSGYPAGLRGVEAPVEGRIVGLVDAYDYLTRPRLGQPVLSDARALRELRRGAGSQFDPELVEAWAEVAGDARPGEQGAGGVKGTSLKREYVSD